MDRREARTHAMKLVYEWEMGGDGGEDTRTELLGIEPIRENAEYIDYMNCLFDGVVENHAALDEAIGHFLRGWTVERLSRVDLAILRIATFELRYRKVAPAVAINEAVELANLYSSDKAGAFINGVLGNMARAAAE